MPGVKALGIDVGSTTVKIVGVDASGEMIWHLLEQAEPRVEEQIGRFLECASQENGRHADLPLVATGYGRRLVNRATRQVTEISCHARGVYQVFGRGGTLVDIGGQDSKAIGITPQGKVIDFAMNDKCAAGTGRFLENTAGRLRVSIENMGEVALSVPEEAAITSTCTVFAESEVISLLAHGTPVPVILRGLHRSLVKRIVSMIITVGLVSPLMLSGGVVRNPAVCRMLEEETGENIVLPEHPQLMGAYGAALYAMTL